jgi:hypothetical protein
MKSILFLLIQLSYCCAHGATIYVDKNGTYKTIPAAYAAASSGDTIIVKSGIYSEYQAGYGIHLNKSGITLRSEVPRGAIVDLLNKSDSNNGFWITGGGHTIDGFMIRNGFLGGMAIWSSNNRIINNEIHHNGNIGNPTSPYGQDGIYANYNASGNLYANNYIHHNGRSGSEGSGDHGIYLCGDNEVVQNNILTYNSGYGLHIAGYTQESFPGDSAANGITNMKVYNNVMAYNGMSGAIIWHMVTGLVFYNNIFYKNKRWGIDSYDAHGSGVIYDHNIFFGNTYQTINTSGGNFTFSRLAEYTSDPMFVNGAAEDYHLTSNSTAAIDKGLNVGLPFLGSAPDIGAYEFGAGAPAGGAIPLPPTNLKAN